MPLSILLNLADVQKNGLQWLASRLEPSRLIYIGLRDLDPFEKDMIAHCGLNKYDMNDIRRYGMATIAAKVAALIGQNPFHVSFDIDSVDPNFAPATGICVADGLTLGELELLGDSLLVKESLKSIDIVEVNPLIGSSQQVEKTYFAAFNFLKTIKSLTQGLSNNKCSKMNSYCLADPNQGGPNDAISRSNKTQHAPQMESSI
jgi:arginase